MDITTSTSTSTSSSSSIYENLYSRKMFLLAHLSEYKNEIVDKISTLTYEKYKTNEDYYDIQLSLYFNSLELPIIEKQLEFYKKVNTFNINILKIFECPNKVPEASMSMDTSKNVSMTLYLMTIFMCR